MKVSIYEKKKVTDKKQKAIDAKMDNIEKWMEKLMDKFDDPSPNKVKNLQYSSTVVHDNRKFPPLEGGHYQKIGGMWTLKHENRSPKFYELLIKSNLKGDTTIDPKNFYNHVNMCLNVVTRL